MFIVDMGGGPRRGQAAPGLGVSGEPLFDSPSPPPGKELFWRARPLFLENSSQFYSKAPLFLGVNSEDVMSPASFRKLAGFSSFLRNLARRTIPPSG